MSSAQPQSTAESRLGRPLGDRAPEAWIADLVAAGARPAASRAAVAALCRASLCDDVPLSVALGRAPAWLQRLAPTLLQEDPLPLVVETVEASDATIKLVLSLPGQGAAAGAAGGDDRVETVIIPSRRGESGGRVTVCVSSQVGCGRRCRFCATGALGLRRQLAASEIIGQLRVARRVWAERRATRPELPMIGNVVFMGMGEPLDNLDAVCTAIEVMTSPLAFGFAAGRITVSTVGVAERVAAFVARSRARLALSLHAPDDERRRALMPVHRHTDLRRLGAALRTALAEAPGPAREVLVAYILIAGFNDADADAELLADWLGDLPARLNLIPANPGPDPTLRPPSDAAVRGFQQRLQARGVRALVRWPHGRDIGGACGQLAAQSERGANPSARAPLTQVARSGWQSAATLAGEVSP